MGIKNIKSELLILLCFMILILNFIPISSASEISSLRISQVNATLPDVTAYLDISDSLGNMVPGILPDQLSVTIGTQSAHVKKITPFGSSHEGIAYILLVDISKSLKKQQFVKIREALNAWIDDISPEDRVLIMTFGTNVGLLQDFTPDKDLLRSGVEGLKPTDNHTQLNLGIARAMEIARRTDDGLPARRVIVTLSDGDDDFAGGMTKQEVLDRIKEEQVPIYAIGFYNPPYSNKKEEYLKILGEFSRTSGGEYYKAGNRSFLEMYTAIRQRIKNVYVASILCDTCTGDGGVYRLQMNISAGQRSTTDGKDIRLLPPPQVPDTPEPQQVSPSEQTAPTPVLPFWQTLPVWNYAAAGGVLLLLCLLVILRRSNPKSIENEVVELTSPVDTPSTDQYEKSSGKQSHPGITVRLTAVGTNDSYSPYVMEVFDSIVLGRDKTLCDVGLMGDDGISTRHCQMISENGMVYVVDLRSTNGIIVNGVPTMGRQRLEEGDMLLLGDSEFRVSVPLGNSEFHVSIP